MRPALRFQYFLARTVFGCTVAEMLRRLSSRELVRWQLLYAREPWGEERADLRMGILAATIANPHRKKGRHPFKPADFMPKFGDRRRLPSRDELLAKLGGFVAAMGALTRGGKRKS